VSCAPALQASAPQRLVRCLVHPSRQLSTQQLVEETHKSRRQVHPRRRPPINSVKPVRIWKDVGVRVDLAVAPHVRRVVVGMDRQIYANTNTLTSDSFMAAGGESVSFLSSAIIILCFTRHRYDARANERVSDLAHEVRGRAAPQHAIIRHIGRT